MANAASDRWEYVSAALTGDFTYKVLVEDTTWQAGDDAAGRGGEEQESWPTF